ncbi:hypothetical protein B5F07_02750 [Lachnoclostridium sp. An169]|uniref:glycosyltransferase n=1 Tax=Lachnoclostridium sp. An169 TaxID=1965569 RepID=UPI000B3935F3|nr:glycosyltransferase [Lachnoclostridium sp. An169]OUP86225.1 hypothetical protein B5F07_02750 [Lachnoclostridium sp. An169]
MGNFKDKIYYNLVRKNPDVQYEYERYVMENIKEHYENHFKHLKILLKIKWHYQVKKSKERLMYFDEPPKGKIVQIADQEVKNQSSKKKSISKNGDGIKEKIMREKQNFLYYENDFKRESVNKFVASIVDYDVISFDIFDTLIYRKVEKPNDIFSIMSAEMGENDFIDIRKKAESFARNIKEKTAGTREIVLSDIYDVLAERFNIDRSWMEREIELELNMSIPNKYILSVYEMLLKFGKTIVFTTDMYLPLNVIKTLVEKNGYTKYDQIFLSNEYGLRKGDGTLQKVLIDAYPNKKIVHIGDNYAADVEKSIEAGIDAVYNPDSHYIYREPELENMAASFYRAVIQTNMNNGLWDRDLYYTHGFRVGGILAAGYCKFINQIVERKKIDKILFCARDCDVIYKIYKEFYKQTEAEYINISRFAIFNVTSEHYLYDLSNRYIMRYVKMYRNTKTMETILKETGYGYLVEELEKYNIDRYYFPATIHDDQRIQEFLYKCEPVIYEHNKEAREAARKYFTDIIGTANNILIVDIGWSGTCITALKYFIKNNISGYNGEIFGSLLATNRNDLIKNSIQFDEIEAYLNTPFTNMDITRHIFPGPPRSRNSKIMDKLHMPFEYLFTSTERSLLGYKLEKDNSVGFVYSQNLVPNIDQIESMQRGMIDFVRLYEDYSKECKSPLIIPPYSAFFPIRECIEHDQYLYEVYKDFSYDAMSSAETANIIPTFSELFDGKYNEQAEYIEKETNGKKILFVSPELIYSGAPRSLLRMCKVARDLGYGLTVWSAKEGPFRREFEKEGFEVAIVPENKIDQRKEQIKNYDMAVCNTVMTSKFAEICCQLIPTVWYIREATNIPDFIRNNPERAYVIKYSSDIYVVSDYAATALSQYANEPIKVVHNCVEDESDMAVPYLPGTEEKIKFVQFGTMEYRKGYDVLLAAYKSLPEQYRNKAELYFAGGFINSGSPFCSYLFREMKDVEGVYYIGLIQGEEEKIRQLSQMDVVVVASRDESCSLVALEGAMLSKPLIVTENVGAKYMVSEKNGYIVKTGDVESLRSAMMSIIDCKAQLKQMGKESRLLYDKLAGMNAYTQSMKQLYALSETKNTEIFAAQRKHNQEVFSNSYKKAHPIQVTKTSAEIEKLNNKVVVSLTSHPGRINIVGKTIDTLINQTVKPLKIVLWLSEEEFPNKKKDLPGSLIVKQNLCDFFEIQWVKDDLKPHKKYFYAMQKYKENPIIIVDDDIYYDEHLVENLLDSYNKFPDCISAMRTNLIGFRRDGSIMDYEGWIMEYRILQDTPSTQLVPTGVGGVLYPPHALPEEAFDSEAIKKNCLFCDDLWLKIWASHAKLKIVMPEHFCVEKIIENSQDVALWKMNVRQGNNNDESLARILQHYENTTGNLNDLIQWIRKDRFC